MIRACRDCGIEGDEAPDDPAPALCPACYDARMARVHAGLLRVVDELDGPIEACAWLAKALHEIGGETAAFATQHANELLLEHLGLDL